VLVHSRDVDGIRCHGRYISEPNQSYFVLILVYLAGRRYQIKHLWAYMLLGQLVAISIAANLFYLAIFLSAPSTPRNDRLSRSASPKIWLSVLLSLATIALSPFTSRQTFLPNLLVMHVLLFVPLISGSERGSKQKPGRYSMDTSTLYRLVCIIALGIRARTTVAAIAFLNLDWTKASLSAVVSAIWDTLYSNPAQSSLGWEVIWNSVSFIAFIIARPVGSDLGRSDMRVSRSVPFLLLATPVASLGVTAPYVLQPRGGPQYVGHTADKMK